VAPLHELIKKGLPFIWKKVHETAFEELKEAVASDQVLPSIEQFASRSFGGR